MELTEIDTNLVHAMRPVWNLPAEQQKIFLESFINKIMARANALHNELPDIEVVKDNNEPKEKISNEQKEEDSIYTGVE
jgi:hypothetical protein